MNLTTTRVLLAASVLILALSTASFQAAHGAELLLLHGRIYTPAGWAQAMAVADGKIIAVGEEKSVRAAAGPRATVIDLAGRTVFPGLHDMHVHPMEAGFTLAQCHIAQGATAEQMLADVAACAKAAGPGAWVTGGQWEAIAFGDTPPNRKMLDKVAPGNPVMLYDISGHSAGRTRAPSSRGDRARHAGPGERLDRTRRQGRADRCVARERDGDGRKTHSAGTSAQNAEALKTALSILLSFGVTELTDAMVGKEELVAYDSLSDAHQLKQRIRASSPTARCSARERNSTTLWPTARATRGRG